MAVKGKLGLYWGAQGINFIEVLKGAVTQKAYLSFSDFRGEGDRDFSPNVLKDPQILEHIQKTLRNSGFSSSDIYLSLPSKDIIVRWFVLPWMKPHEIQGNVAFEVRKFLPFPLEDLTYTYYPSTITQGGVKQIGVVFIGIRKEMLQFYLQAMSQSGLNVLSCEPSSMSLLRALVFRKLVDLPRNVAILQISDSGGEINIASNGFLKFVRDFNFSASMAPSGQSPEDFLKAKLYNEVRISMDFFNRQHAEEVNKIILIASASNRSWTDSLVDELGVPVVLVDVATIVGPGENWEIGAASAFGASLNGDVPAVIDFNISEGEAGTATIKKDRKPPLVPRPMWPVLIGLIAIVIVGACWAITSVQIAAKRSEVANLQNELGEYKDIPAEDIEMKGGRVKKFLAAVKGLKQRSAYVSIMVHLVGLMPKDMWLESFELRDADEKQAGKASSSGEEKKTSKPGEKLSLNFSGYLYKGDTNAEFSAVYQFLATMRSNEVLSKVFSEINLMNTKAQDVDGRSVTAFTVRCQ